MTGETIVDLKKLDLIVGSGGVLSHAPRRSQAMRMIIILSNLKELRKSQLIQFS